MTNRSLLLASAALLIPATPALAQQQSAPATPQQAAPATTAQQAQSSTAPATSTPAPATEMPDEFGDDEGAIVITGSKPRGSAVGDIPPENTLDARDVRATGATNINELLDAIAPQIGSVQGRGGERPVLLLNGQRPELEHRRGVDRREVVGSVDRETHVRERQAGRQAVVGDPP